MLTTSASLALPTAAANPTMPPVSAAAAGAAPAGLAMEPRFARIAEVPRGVVASLAQDRTGFIWFGGGNGLTRYDGYRLQVVDRDTKDVARRNLGWIRALLADEDGRLWIGT
ncbi:MAG TPA: two-component regulator propeller domain-containing protein, partial [Rubrivivax sp.]|nr:two-component regulator propeller domain-containing protein [Rubrivivax sp.]